MKSEKEDKCTVEDYGFENIEKLLTMIGGKWKIQIIYHLSGNYNIRYGQLKRKLPEISHKILSAQLKDLEKDGLIYRTEHDEIVPRVEYLLTELGRSLLPVYEVIGNWCEENRAILELRQK
ncbi:HxlR family transcriptional regulator [Enterococcus ureilyticus]|uniref:HxlR family transcriptional regulator n=1 Tax=Enterococcus ureilyticus TaxID=1131292 RepID=A0A1E5HAX1_9ENTE|nr:helix-turn-helix domain-containing protein [Enterococcus ureilyticus]MBM7690269.1 DNA-binding HxlR family transcriptional regulator [Enterococcus ureilyticus]OEG22088.1 HxlR family transcriptional regulator [Enterococcus ureilyticus]